MSNKAFKTRYVNLTDADIVWRSARNLKGKLQCLYCLVQVTIRSHDRPRFGAIGFFRLPPRHHNNFFACVSKHFATLAANKSVKKWKSRTNSSICGYLSEQKLPSVSQMKNKMQPTGWNGPETANAIINDSFRGCDNFYQINHSCLSFDKRCPKREDRLLAQDTIYTQNVIIIQKFRIYNCLKIKRSTATAFCLVQRYLTILVVLNVAVLTCRESDSPSLFRSPLATMLKQLTHVKVSVF